MATRFETAPHSVTLDGAIAPGGLRSGLPLLCLALLAEPLVDESCNGDHLDLTVQDGATNVSQHCLEDVLIPTKGSYVSVDGQYQAGTGRPLLPTLQVSSGPVEPE